MMKWCGCSLDDAVLMASVNPAKQYHLNKGKIEIGYDGDVLIINEDFDILLLPFGDIELSGFNYGFIGGVGGMISDNSMAFFGSLDNYAFGNEIKKFLYKYDVKPIYLSNTKLIDRGSLLVF